MKMTFLGGADEIGASSILLEVADTRLLIDAGLRPKKFGAASLPDLDRIPEPPDAIILTHAHIDHIGAVPVVQKRYPFTPVLTSQPTMMLAKLMLLDSAYLQRITPGPELYNKSDVEATLDMMRPLLMNRWYHLSDKVAVCLAPAGHLLGAASVLLDTAEGRFVISGDVSITHQRTVPGFAAPHFPADLLILESTYGDSQHPARQEEEKRLIESVTEVVMAGGVALVPSFALGRAQEVILTLRHAQLTNEVPSYPIYADGMVRGITDIYDKQRDYVTPALNQSRDHSFWKKGRVMKVKARERRRVVERPACIVASSGMLIGGPSVFYASEIAEDPDSAIFITGYTDEESPGRRLQQLSTGDEIILDGAEHTVNCQVRKFGLSGHGDVEQLASVVEHFQPRRTLLVHGEKNGRHGLQEYISDRYDVHLPHNSETYSHESPRWMMGQAPYMLDHAPQSKKIGKSYAAEEPVPLAGEAPEELEKIGVAPYQAIVEGALVKRNLPTGFPCIYCDNEKLMTIDLSQRVVVWHCSECGHEYEENIYNLKQKDVQRMSEDDQETLAGLIYVSARLHEPLLDKSWEALIKEPAQWQHWLDKFAEGLMAMDNR